MLLCDLDPADEVFKKLDIRLVAARKRLRAEKPDFDGVSWCTIFIGEGSPEIENRGVSSLGNKDLMCQNTF